MDEPQPAPFGELFSVALRLGVAVADQHDFRAERPHGFDLDLRCRPRHDDDGADADPPGREGDPLRVIPRAGGNDAARPLGLAQARDAVVRPPDLEAEDRLHVLPLEEHMVLEAA